MSRSYRWVICALLFSATSINYVDRQILALLKPMLDTRLHWTDTQFGLINSVFQIAYALGLCGFGWVIDRWGTKIGYAVSILSWSLAAMGHGLVTSLGGFAVARVCLGLGEGGNFPCAIKVVSLWFTQKERAFATSVFNSGSNVGALIAPLFVPFMALNWGWQSPFMAAGLAGIIWLLFWLPLFSLPDRAFLDETEADGEAEHEKLPWLSLLAYRQTWSFILAKLLTDPIWWFYLIWLPDYFNVTRHLDIKHSWPYLTSIYGIITVLSIFGGWLPGLLIKGGWTANKARKATMILCALCVLPIFFVTRVSNVEAVVLIGLAGAAHQAWSANLYTTVSDMFPQAVVASVVGWGSMVGAGMSALFPLLTGRLLDLYKAAGNVTGGYNVLFGLCSAAYLVAFLLNHLCAPSFTPIVTLKRTILAAEASAHAI
jgi:ACS family hexuronate transporter-like MFS transporter